MNHKSGFKGIPYDSDFWLDALEGARGKARATARDFSYNLHIIIILVTRITSRSATFTQCRERSLTYVVYTAALGGRQ